MKKNCKRTRSEIDVPELNLGDFMNMCCGLKDEMNKLHRTIQELRCQSNRDREELESLRAETNPSNRNESMVGGASDISLARIFQGLNTNLESAIGAMNTRFEDVVKSFKEFHGNGQMCIASWIENFTDQAELLNLDQFQRFLYAKRLMKGTAKLFVDYESKATTWPALKKELEEEFGRRLNSAIVHQRLRERTKKRDETNIVYMYEMIKIARQAEVDDAAIISYVADGLPGSPESKGFLYDADDITEFKRKLLSYELLQSKMSNFKTKMEIYRGETRKVEEPSDDDKRGRRPRCYDCGQFGHVRSDCLKGKPTSTAQMNIIQQVQPNAPETEDDEEEEDDVFKKAEEALLKKWYFQDKSRS